MKVHEAKQDPGNEKPFVEDKVIYRGDDLCGYDPQHSALKIEFFNIGKCLESITFSNFKQ